MEDSVMKMAKAIPTNITAYIGHASQLHLFFGQKIEIATALDNKGYGDGKQAVREFAERLIGIMKGMYIQGYTGEEVRAKAIDITDELVKEVCGE